jgi:Xaa-Pro dipeptidase
MSDELIEKERRLRALMKQHRLQGALLGAPSSFAWITAGGDNLPGMGAGAPLAAVVVTHEDRYLLYQEAADHIPAEQVPAERFTPLGCCSIETLGPGSLPGALPRSGLASDLPLRGLPPLPADFRELTASLLPAEVERCRRLGEDVATCVTHACFHLRPGLSEHQIGGMLAGWLLGMGITLVDLQVAADERAIRFTCPPPTANRLRERLMLRVCGRRQGLHIAMTRLVQFSPLDAETAHRHAAGQRLDAELNAATRPGAAWEEVEPHARRAAAAADAGNLASLETTVLGGPTGYSAPHAGGSDRVAPQQPFAWRVAAGRFRSEDTFLATEVGPQLLSQTPDLPCDIVQLDGLLLARPGILVR